MSISPLLMLLLLLCYNRATPCCITLSLAFAHLYVIAVEDEGVSVSAQMTGAVWLILRTAFDWVLPDSVVIL